MFDSESSGTSKGSLKDRLRFLNILMRISRKNKLRLNFYNINASKLAKTNQLFLFFYNPAKIVLNGELKTNNTILYRDIEKIKPGKLVRFSASNDVDLLLSRKAKKKKGIDITSITPKKNALSPNEVKNEKIRDEISKKYNISKENVSTDLINDYIAVMSNTKEVFDMDLSPEIKNALMRDRIKAESTIKRIKEVASDEKDLFLAKDFDYDIGLNRKALEKLNKALEKQKQELEDLAYKIDEFSIATERKIKITNVGSLISNSIGIGIGLLTMPFSFSRSIALGANLIRNSLENIHNRVKINMTEKKTTIYRVTSKDIMSVEKALKTSDFLLDDTLDKLDHLKYKLKLYAYKIADADKKIKEIEALESGLTKKKRDLKKIVESLEKNKVKVLKRDNNN